MTKETPILSINQLNKQYGEGCSACCQSKTRQLEKNYCPKCGTVYACQNISMDLYPGEIVGIVGESGSGKSTLMRCLFFDEEPTSGSVSIALDENIEDIYQLSSQKRRLLRNEKLGMVYQNPYLGLTMSISAIANVAEKMIASGNRHVLDMQTIGGDLLEQVNIPSFRMKEAPANFSGGMQQRVQIAKALSTNPPILFLDEVTTGLDLSVQATVLDIIKRIQQEYGVSMLVVSHDLGVIRMLSERTYVLLNGQVIEHGLTDQILEDPQHEYTQQLVYSLL
ncbi:phosphonate C-P lyase system protein PhnK [Vagococcus penaei]|uniref:Phosphonate C-P lyase system protein PhnK n=1 Tax=Vagococcus penaei TaxID=633807 RepID=A0A1Q2D785_9ENTE|nr:ATP-binding cassette domain-containing protein [Vagococcus penaei]AQP54202.1 phosphonate C-P lyase system protein PhnK [Vagococcus penaei]RST99986.1 phosphonate C-P lyase system protein PhnK [Vagococcus penaei]